jgi:hypothetical protein
LYIDGTYIHDAINSKIPTKTVSEKLIGKLESVENGITGIRGHVDTAKVLFDDVIFKLESFMQILDIVRANEEKRLQGPQVQVSSTKTTKDTVDEILEMLQTPAIQGFLRQILVSLLVKRDENKAG